MVIIDRRDGSRSLADAPDLRGHYQLGELEFGDVMLAGNGPNGSSITVGVEVKSVSDLLQSMENGRLAGHQLPGLIQAYDHPWLAVFGSVRPDADNYLQVLKGGRWRRQYIRKQQPMPWAYLEGFLLTVQMLTPVRVKWCYSLDEIGTWVMVYDLWLSRPWERHRALQVFNRSGERATPVGADPVEDLMARMAAALPGVGWTRAWNAAKQFESVEEMVNAPAEAWAGIDKFGPVLSKAVSAAIRRRK